MLEPREVDIWLVFRNTAGARKPVWRLLDRGFEHVEIWREDCGAWARLEPAVTVSTLEVWLKPPWEVIPLEWEPTCLRVQWTVREAKVRAPWSFGPLTCVDGAKAFLGIWAPWVVTPRQLFNYCAKRFECELAEVDTGPDAGQSDTPGRPAADGAETTGPGRLASRADAAAGWAEAAEHRWVEDLHGRLVTKDEM